jgi:hypothetical protein
MPTKKEPKETKEPKEPKKTPAPTGLTIDDIAKLLNANKPVEKPKRKPVERTAQQKEAMLERLAIMRAKANENRKDKAKYITKELEEINTIETGSNLEVKKMNDKNSDDIFEKKYNTRFEKIDEGMNEIKSHLTEMREQKKAKAEAKKLLLEKAMPKPNEEVSKPQQLLEKAVPKQTENISNHQVNVIPANPNKILKVPNYKSLFKKYY